MSFLVIKSREMSWARHVAWMWERTVAYRVLVERPEGRRPLAKSRLRWEDNIKMDFKEFDWEHGLN
jgi:hypothetical protein